MIPFLKYSFYFVLLVFLQVFVIDELHIHFLITPLFYVFLIIILPFDTPKVGILLIGFVLGMSIDCFENTLGIHAAATTAAALARIITQNILSPRDGYDANSLPSINCMGGLWFLKFSLTIIFVHNLVFYWIDFLNFKSPLLLIEKIFICTTIVFIFLFFANWAFGKRKFKKNL